MINKKLKPIETKYKGHRFRSRLEARWAVFFDKMGWEWSYEHEGFDLPSGYYLPDFYFRDIDLYAEVKPVDFNRKELTKCFELSMMSTLDNGVHSGNVILLVGLPEFKTYDMVSDGGIFDKVILIPYGCKYYPYFCNGGSEIVSLVDHYGIKEMSDESKGARFEFEFRYR